MTTETAGRPTRDEALGIFRTLVARHGLQWGPSVPASAHEQLARINLVLTAADRRATVLGRA